mmetsp:Transcript_10027/g.13970  ORF Transcript_10027/g.13970 Transcript_10027/m.13970 type:complete len:321 (+) Transcript_10027:277-1239(+)|eukprot:CAMPEP_0184479148 /NCGR_PEP_ID=MMETSP0113_2-20130426/982_1 /TAXON_ID=91329 /ORGANISM="Norrisiella sphaerica, Strain BC52" /LENGTH=320 /DNA_ID=CAMNT_0026857165 /DNA_START=118 /DNA_END=1080 /DNA_ORIENTATION=+
MGIGPSGPRSNAHDITDTYEHDETRTHTSSNEAYDCKVKMILLGDYSVGTRAMVMRFWDEQSQYQTYISVDFGAGSVEMNIRTLDYQGKRVRTELSDNAGRSPCDTVADTIYDSASAVLICYSHRNASSFHNAKKWLEHAHKYATRSRSKDTNGRRAKWWPKRVLVIGTDHYDEEDVKQRSQLHAKTEGQFLESGFTRKQVQSELKRISHPIFKSSGISNLCITYLSADKLRRIGMFNGRALASIYTVNFAEVKLADSKSVTQVFTSLIDSTIALMRPTRRSLHSDKRTEREGIQFDNDAKKTKKTRSCKMHSSETYKTT